MKKPCDNCTVCKNPDVCEFKNCPAWRSWFIRKWEEMRATIFDKKE